MKKRTIWLLTFVMVLFAFALPACAIPVSQSGVTWSTSPYELQRREGYAIAENDKGYTNYSYEDVVRGRASTLTYTYSGNALVLAEYYFFNNTSEDPFISTLYKLMDQFGEPYYDDVEYIVDALQRSVGKTYSTPGDYISACSWTAYDHTEIYLYFHADSLNYSILFVEPDFFWAALMPEI